MSCTYMVYCKIFVESRTNTNSAQIHVTQYDATTGAVDRSGKYREV